MNGKPFYSGPMFEDVKTGKHSFRYMPMGITGSLYGLTWKIDRDSTQSITDRTKGAEDF